MKVFAVYNIKGGVGKTASAVNLAHLSAAAGYRTLVWDLDPQGATSFYFRIRPKIKGGAKRLMRGKTELDELVRGTDFRDLDLLPADFSYRKFDLQIGKRKRPARVFADLLQPLASSYDHVYLDCPPNITLLSETIFVTADCLLIPTIPTTLSLRTLERLRRHLRKQRYDHLLQLPFFCMVDRRKKMHREIMVAAAGEDEWLRAAIPFASVVEQMGLHRAPVTHYARRTPAAIAYAKLWEEILAIAHRPRNR